MTCSPGVHPHEAKLWRLSTFDRLEYLARQPGCVAIGECGLDFNRDFSPRAQQLDVFEKQVINRGTIQFFQYEANTLFTAFRTYAMTPKEEFVWTYNLTSSSVYC